MTFEDIIALSNPVDVSGPEPNEIGALVQDSRKVTPGDVFIAISGFKVDGHTFIDDAVRKGASIIICEGPYSTEHDVCIIEVPDTRKLLGPLAQLFAGNPAENLKVIGITGTNGKTTVATLTYQALEKLGAKPSLLGTVAKRIAGEEMESRLTTADPIELANDMEKMVRAGSTHLVMEVSSHALDQDRVNGIPFEVAAFTNLSHDHLDYHETLEAYARSKKKLFDNLEPASYAIINGDDDQAAFIEMDCPAQIWDFSFKKALDIECQMLSNSTQGLVIRVGQTVIESSLIGAFNAYNITEAFLICHALGYEKDEVAKALTNAPGATGRLERVPGSAEKGNPVVLVDYAHTPDALENVLSTLAELKSQNQKLHVVFGCGGDRDKSKRSKMAEIAEKYADRVTVTSDNPRSEKPEVIIDDIMPGFEHPDRITRIADRDLAINKAIEGADSQTMILIAGKGHETYQEINGERIDFDDREIARNALAQRNPNAKTGGV